MRLTDMADELYTAATDLPGGVRAATAKRGGVTVTPRELDSVIAHGAALLGAAINRALQPRLSIAQLCWLVG